MREFGASNGVIATQAASANLHRTYLKYRARVMGPGPEINTKY